MIALLCGEWRRSCAKANLNRCRCVECNVRPPCLAAVKAGLFSRGFRARWQGSGSSQMLELDVTKWAQEQFGTCQLGDVRRTRRAVKFAAQAAANPSGHTPEQTEK